MAENHWARANMQWVPFFTIPSLDVKGEINNNNDSTSYSKHSKRSVSLSSCEKKHLLSTAFLQHRKIGFFVT